MTAARILALALCSACLSLASGPVSGVSGPFGNQAIPGELVPCLEAADEPFAIVIAVCSDAIATAEKKSLSAAVAYVTRADAYTQAGHADLAFADLSRALPGAAEPLLSWVLWVRARAYQLKDQKGEALSDLDRAISLNPARELKSWILLQRASLLLLDERRWPDGRADLDEVVALNPSIVSLRLLRGYLRSLTNDNLGARDDYDWVIEKDPDNALAYIYRASLHAGKDMCAASMSDLNRGLRLLPDHVHALWMRGLCNTLRDNPQGVVDDFSRMIDAMLKMPPESAPFSGVSALSNASDAWTIDRRLEGHCTSLLHYLDDWMQRLLSLPDAYMRRGRALGFLGKSQLALDDAERALALAPDPVVKAEALESIAAALLDLHDYTRAAQAATEGLGLQPNKYFAPLLYIDRGLARLKLGEGQALLADLDNAVAAFPDMAMALRIRCYARVVLNVMLVEAVSDCTRALELDQGDSQTYSSRALAYVRLRKFQLALADAESSIKLQRSSAGFVARALSKRALGDQRGYSTDLETARRSAPKAVIELEAAGFK